jgi:WD40 repeat protein
MQGIAAYLTGTPARAFSVPVVGLAQQAVNGMMIPRFLLGTFVILGLVAAGAGTAIWATPGAEPGRASIESGTGTATHPLSGEERKPVRYQHEGNAETVAFSADGKLVAAQSNRQTVFVWDAATGTLLHRLLLAELSKGEVFGTVPAIDFSPDGKSVVLRRYDGTHWLWELTSGKELVHTPPFIKGTPPGVIGRVRFSPDGNMIASLGGGHTRLLSTKTGEELLRIKGLPYSAAFSPDSRRIALGSSIANIPIRICDTTTGAELSTFNGGFEVRSIAFTADGKIVAGGSLGMVVLIEAATGKEIVRLKAAMKLAYALAFTPDGKTLVSADQGNQVRIWDLASQKERFVLDVIAGTQPPTRPLPGRSLVLSPDGKTLIVSSAADTLHVWDVRTGRKLSP